VNDKDNADLFWALRGGGGNFGVVTEFEFALHAVGPQILAGLIVFPFAQARQVLAQYRQFTNTSPEDLNVWVVLRQAPPLPFLPQNVHGKEVVVLPIFYSGMIAEGQKLVEKLRTFGDPHGEHIGPQPYTEWQKAFDPLLTPGARNYWKSHNFTELSDGAIDSIIEYAGKLPSPHCEIFIGHIAGPQSRGRRRHGLRASGREVRLERARPMGKSGAGYQVYRLGARVLQGQCALRLCGRLY
jgi:hypothetical protein